jgi:hypothetical protein
MTIQGRGLVLAAGIPAVLLAGVVIFAGCGWVQEHDARVKAETQTGQQQQQIDGLEQQQVTAQLALNGRLASIEEMRRKPATATELVTETAALLPGLPAALQVRSVPVDSTVSNGPVEEAVVVPQADFKVIRDTQLNCEESTAKLAACLSTQVDSSQQLKLTEEQREEWKSAAKGGSMWHRALGAAKWFAIGAGSGAVAYAVARHK